MPKMKRESPEIKKAPYEVKEEADVPRVKTEIKQESETPVKTEIKQAAVSRVKTEIRDEPNVKPSKIKQEPMSKPIVNYDSATKTFSHQGDLNAEPPQVLIDGKKLYRWGLIGPPSPPGLEMYLAKYQRRVRWSKKEKLEQMARIAGGRS